MRPSSVQDARLAGAAAITPQPAGGFANLALDLGPICPRELRSGELKSLAKRIYRFRRKRDQILGDDLFGEPVWDLLLDLYVAGLEGRQIGITSACLGAAVPSSTALRYVRDLERRELLVRRTDPGDRRRSHLRLSDRAVVDIESLLMLWSAAS